MRKGLWILGFIILGFSLFLVGYFKGNIVFNRKALYKSQSLYIWDATKIGSSHLILDNREKLKNIVSEDSVLNELLQKYIKEEMEYKDLLGVKELKEKDYQEILLDELKELYIDTVFLSTGYSTGIYKEVKREIYRRAYSKEEELTGKKLLKEINEEIQGEVYLRKNHEKYNNFIKKAEEKGIQVEALYGTPEWALKEHYDSLREHVEDVLMHNEIYSEGRFSAIHLDIEPHTLEEWHEEEKIISKQYINNLKKIRKLIDLHNYKNQDDLLLKIDISYNCDKALIDKLLETVDEVNVMNYFNNLDEYKNKGKNILNIVESYNQLKSTHKKVKISSEFQNMDELKDNTLYYMNESEIKEYFNDAVKEFEKFSSFNGIGIHEYESYKKYVNGEF